MRRAVAFTLLACATLGLGLAVESQGDAKRALTPLMSSPTAAAASFLLDTASAAATAERPTDPGLPTPAIGTAVAVTSSVPTGAPLEGLRAALEGGDPWRQREAVVAVVDARDASAIPLLIAADVRSNGYVGAAVIEGLGQLAHETSDPSLRTRATGRLLEIVRDERAGTAPASIGNVLLAVEALGVAEDPAASRPLAAELIRHELPTSVLVQIVQTLAQLGDRSALGAIRSFRDRLAAEREADPFEEEVRREAIAAAEEADRSLGG
jgi:hypothetical protein